MTQGLPINLKQIMASSSCLEDFDIHENVYEMMLYNNKTNEVLLRIPQNEINYDIDRIDYNEFYRIVKKWKKDYFDKDSFIENACLVPFSKMFAICTMLGKRIPSPIEFAQFYCYFSFYTVDCDFNTKYLLLKPLPYAFKHKGERHGTVLKDNNTEVDFRSLCCRIMKNYPSLVREAILFRELTIFASSYEPYIIFTKNSSMDVLNDCDIMCDYNNRRYSLSIYNSSSYSLNKRKEKVRERNRRNISEYCHLILESRLQSNRSPDSNSNTIRTQGGLDIHGWDIVNSIIYFVKQELPGEFHI